MIRRDIDRSTAVDIAVAFTLNSGLDLLVDHFADLLVSRNGRLRYLTGDYLDVTDPIALRRIGDLEGSLNARVFHADSMKGFHPKTYICHFADGSGVAYIGSSNVTGPALTTSVEWNYRVIQSRDSAGFAQAVDSFEDLFSSPETVELTTDWIIDYEKRRKTTKFEVLPDIEPDPDLEPATPNEVQREALKALEDTRKAGNTAGLVVLATGVGKTWLSAFDSCQPNLFKRVLFVAHRDEILTQALNTYRRIKPKASLGRYTGKEKNPNADIIFASIQTMGRVNHLRNFAPDEFNYIVVDEFHHAAAATYRKLIDYFEPKFLLGLTATPERMDGGDLLGLCQENLVFRYDLFEGIDSGLLSPFKYFGVPDEVDYENIPWRSRSFDPNELTEKLATQARANNALEHYQDKAGKKALIFCCSQKHADFMSQFFQGNGYRAAAVHAGETSDPRADSLEKLGAGELDMICAVDMFNEGVDVPTIDTVMLLRPTESTVLWLQQIGRGLRKAADKTHLTIIDYIGNHRSFLNKPKALLQLGASPAQMRFALKQLRDQSVELPEGCTVTYDMEALDILESLLPKARVSADVIEAYYEDYRERLGVRPTALEAFHDGYHPGRTGRASWLAFVAEMGDLSDQQAQLVKTHFDFFASLDKTQMVKSYKMAVLQGMLLTNAFPGKIAIQDLVVAVRRIVARSSRLQADFGPAWQDDEALRRLLERNPIEAWVGAKGTARKYFDYESDEFRTLIEIDSQVKATFADLTREVVDWRLADYLSRSVQAGPSRVQCKVIQSNGRPFIKLPDGDARDLLPTGPHTVAIDGKSHVATFAKIAINKIEEAQGQGNILPQILRRWFGPDAGQPGTRFTIDIVQDEQGWVIAGPEASADGPQLWRRYSREQIPGLYGFEFNTGAWNAGFVRKDGHTFLLVTLDKQEAAEAHQYSDYFVDRSTFHWQSQNQTTPSSKAGQSIKDHEKQGISVHLFIRPVKKEANKAAPFYYCGDVKFQDWKGGEGKKEPISVTWKLLSEVPESIFHVLASS
jgi:superfamily II DNA or RNA helicase